MARKYAEVTAKPTNDAYTGMLAISLLALLVGCGLLYMDYAQYPEKGPQAMERSVKDRPSIEKDEGATKKSGDDKKEPDDTNKDAEKKDGDKDK